MKENKEVMTLNYIYKITNLINKKVYIGQTHNSVAYRWSQHVSDALSNKYKQGYNFLLHKAIRKYGKDSFEVEIIEEVEESGDLSNREQFWINFYHSCILEENANGYNMTYGGEGSSKINKYELYKLWLSGKGSLEIAKLTGHSDISVRNNLQTFEDYDKELDFARNTGTKVYCYNDKGELICSYPSIAYASKKVGVDPSVISKCCNKVKNSAGGYFWSYKSDAHFEPQNLKRWNKYRIVQLSLNNEKIAIYDSLSAAGCSVNKKQTKYIKECCDGIRADMYGYKWKYENEYVDDLAQTAAARLQEKINADSNN